jgi:hypothetical protein
MPTRDWFPRKTPVPIGTDITQMEAIVISGMVLQELRGDCPQPSVTMATEIEKFKYFNHAETVDHKTSTQEGPFSRSLHSVLFPPKRPCENQPLRGIFSFVSYRFGT